MGNGASKNANEHNSSHFCRVECQKQSDTRVQFSPVELEAHATTS